MNINQKKLVGLVEDLRKCIKEETFAINKKDFDYVGTLLKQKKDLTYAIDELRENLDFSDKELQLVDSEVRDLQQSLESNIQALREISEELDFARREELSALNKLTKFGSAYSEEKKESLVAQDSFLA